MDILATHSETVGAGAKMPARQRMQSPTRRRAEARVLLLQAFMCRRLVNKPWLLEIDDVRM